MPFIEKRYPFHIPTLEHCTPFQVNEQTIQRESTTRNATGASIRNSLIKGPFKYLNDRFPYPLALYTSTCESLTLTLTPPPSPAHPREWNNCQRGKNARLPRSSLHNTPVSICTHDVTYSSWTFALIIVFLCKRLQYSGRMTIKDLPKELLKIKGREPLPQIYPNHINNMATKTHADPSFKSKHFSLVLEFKFNVSFSLVVLRGFMTIITGLIGEYSMCFQK